MLKDTYPQKEPERLIHRDCKNFMFENLKKDLHAALMNSKSSCDACDSYFISSLNKDTQRK